MHKLSVLGLAALGLAAGRAPAQKSPKVRTAAAKIRAPQRRAPSQEELIRRRDAKLAEPWVAKGGWISDYDKARSLAKKKNKLIFTYFTRSYAP